MLRHCRRHGYRLLLPAALLVVLVVLGAQSHKAAGGETVIVEEVENCALAERLSELVNLSHTIIAVTPTTAFDIQNRQFCIECSDPPTCFINNGWQVWTYNVVYY